MVVAVVLPVSIMVLPDHHRDTGVCGAASVCVSVQLVRLLKSELSSGKGATSSIDRCNSEFPQ